MHLKKLIPFVATFALALPYPVFANFIFKKDNPVGVAIAANEEAVVNTALNIFRRDYQAVFAGEVTTSNNAQIFLGTLGNGSAAEKELGQQIIQQLKLHKEAYAIEVKNDKIYILGSDSRGTAYGILELSRRIGVSPWEWWADATIERRDQVVLKNGFKLFEYPSVALRGIFINDEDWGLTPWSYLTHEPSKIKGQIGPKTNARIFELLLRLRANTYWPAMHDVSVAFYQTPGNKEMANQYGIIMGASHCEPMMRNANTEWKIDGKGNYDFVNNRDNVLNFWQERVKELKGADNLYTLGIRGVHDGKMQGANTLQEQKAALVDVLKDQREMIKNTLNSNPEKVPQVFIPYKEVLDVYHMGLQVPDDVTLLWSDDNYGYIRHFPNETERKRKGGNGVYYHVSYWGRPHDYLWLATNHPAQVYTQMKMAYDKGARDIWMLNVGDIKPAEYLTELFLDMAWNIDQIKDSKEGLDRHLQNWLSREFGAHNAPELLSVMNEYYRLAYIRKPEFMANTRTEEKDAKFKEVSDLAWTEQEIKTRITEYEVLSNKVIELSKFIKPEKQDAWFELIAYPVRAAAEMNKKHLYGQLARHGIAPWAKSDDAFEAIEKLTANYNALGNGKWKNMMNAHPRDLTVYQKVPRKDAKIPMAEDKKPFRVFNGLEYSSFKGAKPVSHGLGYNSSAISLKKGSTVSYAFKYLPSNVVDIELNLAPNHPVDGEFIRYEISIDGKPLQVVDYHTVDRNEEWKLNVLRNQAIRITNAALLKKGGSHVISIKALDDGVVLDQVKVWKREMRIRMKDLGIKNKDQS